MDYNQQLLSAARDGDIAKLKMAIKHGADLDAKSNDDWTATMVTALNGHTECLALLIEAGVDLDAKDKDGWTAAMWAAINERSESLAALIQSGINPTKETIHDKTVFEIAQDAGWENVISAWENQVVQKKIKQRTSNNNESFFGL